MERDLIQTGKEVHTAMDAPLIKEDGRVVRFIRKPKITHQNSLIHHLHAEV